MFKTEEEIRSDMEPGLDNFSLGNAEAVSLAISMKRIADKMCGDTDLAWHIRDAIEMAIFHATRR
jgi:hypothetical protein